MNYLKNHCWCSESIWGGFFDCSIIVSLLGYEKAYMEDWNNLVEDKVYFSLKEFQSVIAQYTRAGYEISDSKARELATKKVKVLKPEVFKWLEENVPDYRGGKGWAVGSDEYNISNISSFSVFFQRRKDAMKFIKTWSKWKKPIHYCQYFTDVRKELDLETGKYISK